MDKRVSILLFVWDKVFDCKVSSRWIYEEDNELVKCAIMSLLEEFSYKMFFDKGDCLFNYWTKNFVSRGLEDKIQKFFNEKCLVSFGSFIVDEKGEIKRYEVIGIYRDNE